MMMSNFVLFFACTLLIGTTFSFPTGAPDTVCESMTPQHGDSKPQESPSPYKVIATKLPSGQAEVVLSSESNIPFKGFMLQARLKTGSPAIGSFVNVDPNNSYTRNCSGGFQNSLTQISSEGKTSVAVTWQAPNNVDFEDVEFVATFVRDFHTFWVGVKFP